MDGPIDQLARAELVRRCLELEAVNEELRTFLRQQEQRIAELERKLASSRKNSGNSSKPPSSDIVKPPKPDQDKGTKRSGGGQPGHAMHDRPPFGPEQINDTQVHDLTGCPGCGGAVQVTDNAPRILQKVELKDQVPWTVTEHKAHAFYCAHCKQVHYAPIPPEVERGGMLGPKLMALIAYLKAVHHASFSTIRKHFRDVLRLPISRGRLAKAVRHVSESLEHAHNELGDLLAGQSTLRIDETGHKDQGQRHWTWCFRAEQFTWFKIEAKRSSQVLFDMLGADFAGVLGCDYFSAYRKYMADCDVRVQFCLAHLIRQLKYLAGLPEATTAVYGQRLLDHVRQLFQVIHQGAALDPAILKARLHQISQRIIRTATTGVPDCRECRAMARRFAKHGKAYFQFITTPGIEPTNNLAEQAIRFVVIDRRITQGTRGAHGRHWCQRIWTILATCAQQGRNVLQFLIEATTAWATGQPPPSLAPATVPS